MSLPLGLYFFVSYSRADIVLQRKIVTELRKRGVNAWVDTENLIPGSPAWEREIERSIRGASGVIVLLSPDSNDSQWVRRELSFAEEIDKRLFPVHIRGDETDSIPLRLSAHQRADIRRNFNMGMDGLAAALNDHLGTTAISKRPKLKPQRSLHLPSIKDLKTFALPAALVLTGLLCIGGLAFAVQAISNINIPTPTSPVNTPPVVNVTSTPTDAGVVPIVNYPNRLGRSFIPATSAAMSCALSMPMAPGSVNSQIHSDRPTRRFLRMERRSYILWTTGKMQKFMKWILPVEKQPN